MLLGMKRLLHISKQIGLSKWKSHTFISWQVSVSIIPLFYYLKSWSLLSGFTERHLRAKTKPLMTTPRSKNCRQAISIG